MMQVRPADADEIDLLARLWCNGWHEPHAPLSPLELIRLRTLASFRDFVGDVERSFPGGTVALRKTAHSLKPSRRFITADHDPPYKLMIVARGDDDRAAA
jgi:hypothetical protein